MPSRYFAVVCAVLLGTRCSSPLATSVDASPAGAGGSGNGGRAGAGATFDSGTGAGGLGPDAWTAGLGGTTTSGGGSPGAVGTGGSRAAEGQDAEVEPALDAPAPAADVPMILPDVHPSEGEGGAGGGSATGGTGGAATTSTGPRPFLKKFVGNTATTSDVRSDFLSYWDQLTPEYAGKYGSISTEYMQYDWSKLDLIYDFTRKSHIPFHEVAFIYQTSAPNVLGNGEKARAGIEDWIRSFCARYPDTELISVIYEALHILPTYREALGGAGASGYDWMVQAFTWARQYCPNSILLLTDYDNIEYPSENQATIKIVNALLAAGAPIDAIGAEGHDAARVPTSTVKAYIEKLAATGLPIYITEYDINEEDDTKQEATMREQFPVFWTDERIRGITYWGYVVGETWRRGTGLITADGTPRPAMTWLMSYLGR
jgi:endo-1,4-beta-xylanase